jgi:succinate dehydrogenase/fumarate reductase flavoprotein subunit
MICANVPVGSVDPRDGPEPYEADMVRAGYGLNDRRLVHTLAMNALPSFEDLVALGVPFVREGDGYAQRLLAGNTYPRGVYTSGGGMGPVIMDALAGRAAELGVLTWNGHYVLSLLLDDGEVAGALLANYRTGALTAVQAGAVILAMGGIGRLYEDTTYPTDVAADSYALALEAGATLIDMEFVQFEPTVTVHPGAARGMEMPTAMLGDGATMLNANGERFMFRYNPVHGERLIEKARMSLCIQQEIDEGRGLPDGTVFFDTTVMPHDKLESYVSHCKRLRRAGLEPTAEMPRVRPAAHSMMGGVFIDENGYSGVPGLYACGEASGGTHGASRMAGNSGAETLVMGWVVGAAAGRAAGRRKLPGRRASLHDAAVDRFGRGTRTGAIEVKTEIRRAVSSAAALYRTDDSLREGLASLDRLAGPTGELGGKKFRELLEARTARNMLVVGRTILQGALARTESRGAHRRLDYPDQDDGRWLHHLAFRCDADGTLQLGKVSIQ